MRNRNSKREQLLNEIAEAVFFKLLEEGVIDHNGQYVNEGWWDSTKKAARTAAAVGGLALTTFLGGGKAQAQDVQAPDQTYQMTRDTSTRSDVARIPGAESPANIVNDSITRINAAIENFVKGTGNSEYSKLFANQFFKGVSLEDMEKTFPKGFKIQGTFTVRLPAHGGVGVTLSGGAVDVLVRYNLSKPKESRVLLTLLNTTADIPGAPGEDTATFDQVKNSNTPLGNLIIDQITEPLEKHQWMSVLEAVTPVFEEGVFTFKVANYKRMMGGDLAVAKIANNPDALYRATMNRIDALGGRGRPASRLLVVLRNPDLNPVAAVENIDKIF